MIAGTAPDSAMRYGNGRIGPAVNTRLNGRQRNNGEYSKVKAKQKAQPDLRSVAAAFGLSVLDPVADD
jgi:hypothetical protein